MNAIPTTRPVDVLSALIERERCDGTVGVPALDRAEAWLAERAQLDADAPSPLVAQLQQQLDTLRGHIREIAARAAEVRIGELATVIDLITAIGKAAEEGGGGE